MQIGMNLPVMVPGLTRELILEWSRRIDAGPFSSLAAGERITFPNPEIIVTLATAAAVTERVRIVPTVVVLPMHPAGLVAKQIATLDVVSGGRVTLGVGVGARAEDYRALEVPFEQPKLRRLEAQVAELRRAWSGEPLSTGDQPIEPLPVQPGGPPILAGALAAHSIRRAARWADGICGFSFGPSCDEIQQAFETAREAWRDAGRAEPPRLVTSCWFALGTDARAQLDGYIGRYLNFLGPGVAAQIAPTCSVVSGARLRQTVADIASLGCDELILVPTTLDPNELDRAVEHF